MRNTVTHDKRWRGGGPEYSAVHVTADARWLPRRFDVERDEFVFEFITADELRDKPFVVSLDPSQQVARLPRGAVIPAPASGALRFIMHSSQGGSTLLARALGQAGVATPLLEPPILTDVIAFGLRRPAQETRDLLVDSARLLGRPFPGDDAVILKLSHIGNGLCIPMAEMDPASKILCLDTSLEEMLSSYAGHGAEGRRAARKLLIAIRNSRMVAVEFPEGKYAEFIDLQLAALAWLSMRKMMLDTAARLGATRVRSIKSAQFFGDPGGSLAAIAGFFSLDLDVEQRLQSGLFEKHAKTDEPFSPAKRADRTAERLRLHHNEIDPVVDWTRKVAEANGIAWDLPYPLID